MTETTYALPIKAGAESDLIEQLKSFAHHKKAELLDWMQHEHRIHSYHAFVQHKPTYQGKQTWLIESWVGDDTPADTIAWLQKDSSHDIQHELAEIKNAATEHAANKLQGSRFLVDVNTAPIVGETSVVGSVLALLPGQYPTLLKYLDQLDNEFAEQRQSYADTMGIESWHAWLQQWNDQEFLVQRHRMRDDWQIAQDAYAKIINTPFAQCVLNMGQDVFGLDWQQADQWQKIEPVIALKG